MTKKVDVVVGLMINNQSEVLSQLRKSGSHYSGYWEFPGGKVEPGETKQQAVIRELAEEIGVDVRALKKLGLIEHQYPDKLVCLSIYQVMHYYGRPYARERGSQIEWIHPERLIQDYRCLPTCQMIVNKWLGSQKIHLLETGD